MDLWQLHIFCRVVELKSFSLAAKRVHLSQPTISNHIRELEEHFGCRLIDRMAKEVLPTKAGDLLYDYAIRLLALRDEAETALAEFQGKIKGRLVIGGSTIPGVYILPRLVGAFVRQYPEVTVSITIGDTEEIVRNTLSGSLELGIVGAKSGEKQLVQEKLVEDEMRLIVPAGHRWADKEAIDIVMLTEEPYIVREPGSGTLESVQKSLLQAGYAIDNLKVAAEMGSTAAVIQGIKNEVGVSILSVIAVAEELQAGTLKALSINGMQLRRNFYLTTCKDKTPSPLANAFIRFIREGI